VVGLASGGGMFGAQARAQYAALARLRWHMFSNGLRSRKGALELGARTVSFIFYGLGGLAMGVGAGFAAFALTIGNHPRCVGGKGDFVASGALRGSA